MRVKLSLGYIIYFKYCILFGFFLLKLRSKISEEQQLNKIILNARKRIIDDRKKTGLLMSTIHIDSQFDRNVFTKK